MNPRVSPYLKRIRDWKMQYIVAHYLKSYALFGVLWEQYHEHKKTTFPDWCRLCDFLFEAKEANNLLFHREKRAVNENERLPGKYIPTIIEAALINNIGLIFHKAMMMRELQYVLDQYVEESSEFQESRMEFERIFKQLKKLYADGSEFLLAVLRDNAENMPLLSFFIEKKGVIEQLYNMCLHEIFEMHFGPSWLEKTYGAVSHYFEASGWSKRAEFVRHEIQRIKELSNSISGGVTVGAVAPE